MKGDMERIRKQYDVPARNGARVRYTGGREPQEGTIIRASGHHIIIRLDGELYSHPYHPTWKIEYL